MTYIRAAAVRYADHHFPGWVKVEFQQADRSTASFVAKVAEFHEHDRLTRDAVYPIALQIDCDLVNFDLGRQVATVDLGLGNGIYDVPLELLGGLPNA
ncbi:hypothetical protein ACWCW7_05925 [Nocardia tengchongensis]